MALKRMTEEELGRCEPARHDLQILTQPFVHDKGIVPDLVSLAFCKRCGNTALIKIDGGTPTMPGGINIKP